MELGEKPKDNADISLGSIGPASSFSNQSCCGTKNPVVYGIFFVFNGDPEVRYA